MENEQTEFPNKNDVLFVKSDKNWKCNACLFPGRYIGFRDGFKKAANYLSEQIIKNPNEIDYFIYPIVYLYRHYIELALKEITIMSKKLIGEEENFDKIHGLNSLWKKARQNIETLYTKEKYKEDLDGIESYIGQFEDIDPTSQSFRYPFGKKGDIILNKDLTINLQLLYDKMNKMENLLDSILMDLYVNNDYKEEYDSYLYKETYSYDIYPEVFICNICGNYIVTAKITGKRDLICDSCYIEILKEYEY